jgi:hypothetical protein
LRGTPHTLQDVTAIAGEIVETVDVALVEIAERKTIAQVAHGRRVGIAVKIWISIFQIWPLAYVAVRL